MRWERPARLRASEVSGLGWGSCTSVAGLCVPTRSSPVAPLPWAYWVYGGFPRPQGGKGRVPSGVREIIPLPRIPCIPRILVPFPALTQSLPPPQPCQECGQVPKGKVRRAVVRMGTRP